MIKRLKNLWRLSELETKQLQKDLDDGSIFAPRPLGDGKAVFLPDMTEEDYVEYTKSKQGWTSWLSKFGIK